MDATQDIVQELQARLPDADLRPQAARDGVPTAWVGADRVHDVLRHLQTAAPRPYRQLYDLTAIDERRRTHRASQPAGDFTLVYHLCALDAPAEVRLKVPLAGDWPRARPVTDLWPAANWYAREVWDMFGIAFDGHPNLARILMPPWWEGHPLRKEHPARATDLGPFRMPDATQAALESRLQFRPEEWGLPPLGPDSEMMYLNIGPNHPGTHGVLRLALQLDGQRIADLACDIGFHHRGAEKMGERQTWHTYIPYTDRIDYLGGVLNNFPYVLAVEQLAGITVPERAKVIRILLAELFRIISHLVYYGTFSQDLGAMSPVFYMFTDRERALDVVEAITGARMHPGWFRVGGVAQDLPAGWDRLVRDFLAYLPPRLDEYDRVVLRNRIFQARTRGISALPADEAVAWGVTGPLLRACGLAWDYRKRTPYGGYDQFAFDVPTGRQGDCYDRAVVHVEEMRQSLRIIAQCLENMPAGPYKADHPLAMPPPRERMLHDIETLIHHFVGVSWGPVVPPGEAAVRVEAAKGCNSYYLVSDGSPFSYRTRIRTPSFAHLQLLPRLSRGVMIPDLIAILGSLDYVLADVDR